MKNKKAFHFEKLSSIDSFKLVGGFSSAFNDGDQQDSTQKVNNCKGGNLKIGCGTGRKERKDSTSKHTTNKNCKGNCVPGCGGKK